MRNFNFAAEPADAKLLVQIAARAVDLYTDYSRLEALMDLTYVHMNVCALDLEALLHAPPEHLAHDIGGIRGRLDREAGVLMDDWTPRYSKPWGQL